jgi:hypothetical protein
MSRIEDGGKGRKNQSRVITNHRDMVILGRQPDCQCAGHAQTGGRVPRWDRTRLTSTNPRTATLSFTSCLSSVEPRWISQPHDCRGPYRARTDDIHGVNVLGLGVSQTEPV